MPVPVLLLTIGAVIVGSGLWYRRPWAESNPPPAAHRPPATVKQRAYLRALLAERDDAEKFVSPDDPWLSKSGGSRLIRRLVRERASSDAADDAFVEDYEWAEALDEEKEARREADDEFAAWLDYADAVINDGDPRDKR